jgi:phosphatidylserine synthase
MQTIGKYNVFKGISTALTVGTPIVSLASCSELFIHRSDTAISAAGVFAILFAILFLKDKLMENIKIPSPFVISLIGLVVISMLESIIYPMKIVFVTTAAVTCVDTFTFRSIYKRIERMLHEKIDSFKKFGFIFGTTEDVMGE